jgi:SAM-dependent methyltransferase
MCDAAARHPDFRKHPESGRVIAGDAANLPLADSSADCAIAFMCLQDIDDMPGTLKEIARVLEDGKQLALAIVHPMYSHDKVSGIASGVGKDVSVSRDYFAPELRISTDQWGDLTVTFYREHRPLDTYMTALLDAGFAIDQWHEVTETDKTRPNHCLPMFLDILATKKPRFATKKPPEIPHTAHDVTERRPSRHPGNSCAGGNPSLARRLAISASRRCTDVVPQSIAAGRRFGPLLIFGALVLAMLRS